MIARLLEYGPTAWLLDVDGGTDAVLHMARAVRHARNEDVAEIVPGAATVLVTVRPGADHQALGGWLAELAARADVAAADVDAGVGAVVEIPVTYDGADLDDVARRVGLTTSEVVERHGATTYRCAFCGFAPGFAYLTGLDPALHLPRRATPRTRVPAGSVAIAAEYVAVYPSASPGGWHLLGHTDVVLWDVHREPLALVEPGAAVRFVRR